ncbi:MAG: hypothetical protein [Inoviridae sp.]|nr:MAG: hypothetical protein [Inoviridae sp.]
MDNYSLLSAEAKVSLLQHFFVWGAVSKFDRVSGYVSRLSPVTVPVFSCDVLNELQVFISLSCYVRGDGSYRDVEILAFFRGLTVYNIRVIRNEPAADLENECREVDFHE